MAYTKTERYTLVSTILASSMVFIDGTTVNIALPTIQSDLGISGSGLLWVMDAYLLTLASLMLVGGSIGDYLGRNRVFLWGLALFTLASISCGLSFSPLQIIISRLLQGVGGALLTPGSLSLITTHFSAGRVGGAIGLWSTFSALTSVSGPLLGGWLSESGLWRLIFLINVPLSVIAFLIILKKIPETRNVQVKSLDYTGAVLITLGLSGLAFGFIESSGFGFGNVLIIFSLLAGMLGLIAFVMYERNRPDSLMPAELFRFRNFSAANALTLFLYGSLSALTFFLPLNLVRIQGYSEWQGGLVFFPMVLIIALLSPVSGFLTGKVGARIFLIAGPAITGAGFYLFSAIGDTAGPSEYWHTFFLPVLLLGIGMGLTVAPLTTLVMRSVDRNNSGSASGINNSVSRIAGLMAIALLGTYALHHFSHDVYKEIVRIGFGQDEIKAIMRNTGDFADARVPESITGVKETQLRQLFRISFIHSFNLVSHVSAYATWMSALVALFFIRRRIRTNRSP